MAPRHNLRLLVVTVWLVLLTNAARVPNAPFPSGSPLSASNPTPTDTDQKPKLKLYNSASADQSSNDQELVKLDSSSSTELPKSSNEDSEVKKEPDQSFDSQKVGEHDPELVIKLSNLSNEDPEVKKICDATDYPQVCAGAVIPGLKGPANIDSILIAAVKAGNKIAKEAHKLAKQLANNPNTPPEVKSIIKDCKEGYQTAEDNFKKSLDALPEQDIGTIRSVLSGTITYLAECKEEIAKVQRNSPLVDFAVQLHHMTSNCLAIVALVKSP